MKKLNPGAGTLALNFENISELETDSLVHKLTRPTLDLLPSSNIHHTFKMDAAHVRR